MENELLVKSNHNYPAICVGILFQKSKDITWEQVMEEVKAETIRQWKEQVRQDIPDAPAIEITMPCSNRATYKTFEDIPLQDVPCPCGDPTHWLVQYQEI